MRLARLEIAADPAVDRLDLTEPEDRVRAIELLCGEPVSLACADKESDPRRECPNCVAREQLAKLPPLSSVGVLNQALLFCHQRAVTADFYEAFFGDDSKRESDQQERFKTGLKQFRGYSLLAFGNFRHAFRTLVDRDRAGIEKALGEHVRDRDDWSAYYRTREHGETLIDPKLIPVQKRWYLGYLSSELVLRDRGFERALRRLTGESDDEWAAEHRELIDRSQAILQTDRKRVDRWKDKLKQKSEELDAIDEEISTMQRTGRLFTAAYLAARHIDVYVATSMRDTWEFEETADLIGRVFGETSELYQLDLTYFDPTLSYSESRIDKGLVEGLMLRRARATLYMVQEGETLGKDSELAATLGQGKPVIAYIPERIQGELVEQLEHSPVDRAFKRMNALLAERKLEPRDIDEDLWEVYRTWPEPTFRLDPVESFEAREAQKDKLRRLYRLIATAERSAYESRVKMLTQKHPLALQLQHGTGVATGLLVARSPQRCIELLKGVLLNQLVYETVSEPFGTYLYEAGDEKTRAPYRVVSRDQVLTNAFWHFLRLPT